MQTDPGDEQLESQDVCALDDCAECQDFPLQLKDESLEAYRERIGVQ